MWHSGGSNSTVGGGGGNSTVGVGGGIR